MKNLHQFMTPLSTIALLIGLCEIGFGILATQTNYYLLVIIGMVLLPYLVAAGFFYVLINCPHNLYAPSDFHDQKDFLLLNKKVQRIEKDPFIQFSKLSESAIRLFLAAYYEKKRPDSAGSRDERWDKLLKTFSTDELNKGFQELEAYSWLSKSEKPFGHTMQGEKAHQILQNFLYSRLG